jgi:hypothetical protein
MEYAEVYNQTIRKARKDHKGLGGAMIKKGAEYKYVSGIFDGEPFDYKVNLKLAEFVDSYNKKLDMDDWVGYDEILECDWTIEELNNIRWIYIEEGFYGNWMSALVYKIDRSTWEKKEVEYLERIEELEGLVENYGI